MRLTRLIKVCQLQFFAAVCVHQLAVGSNLVIVVGISVANRRHRDDIFAIRRNVSVLVLDIVEWVRQLPSTSEAHDSEPKTHDPDLLPRYSIPRVP